MDESKETHTKPLFNSASRVGNIAKSSILGIVSQVVNLLMNFIFRTLFIYYLSKEYLGLNGLFTNILNFLSLAELGIGGVIVYRMYQPIAQNNVDEVAKLMRFYKIVYRIIALSLTVIGLALMPALPYLIKDASEIPSDVNLYVIYAIYLSETVSSYFFVYKTSIFSADQKQYFISIMNISAILLKFSIRILILVLTKNYTIVMLSGVVLNIVNNIIFSLIAQKRYYPIFKNASKLDKATINGIKKDVLGMLCHKIGSVVVFSTDNILIAAFIGISAGGLYSNYSMVISAASMLISQLFIGLTSSVGNYRALESKDSYYNAYRNIVFASLAIASCAAIALFTLINPFIEVWIGADYLLGVPVVIALSVSFFISQARVSNNSFFSASGLFRYEKWRPLAEIAINLIASITLVHFFGLIGIFLGTIISSVSIVFWRECTFLHKKEFTGKNPAYFFAWVLFFFVFSVAVSTGLYFLFNLFPVNIGFLLLRFAIAGVVPIGLLSLFTFRTPQYKYLMGKIKGLFRKIFKKFKKTTPVIIDTPIDNIKQLSELDGGITEDSSEIEIINDDIKSDEII